MLKKRKARAAGGRLKKEPEERILAATTKGKSSWQAEQKGWVGKAP